MGFDTAAARWPDTKSDGGIDGEGKTMTPDRANEHKDEADRLALLPVADQRAIIAMHRADAANPKVPRRDREYAAERAKALARFLGLTGKRKPK